MKLDGWLESHEMILELDAATEATILRRRLSCVIRTSDYVFSNISARFDEHLLALLDSLQMSKAEEYQRRKLPRGCSYSHVASRMAALRRACDGAPEDEEETYCPWD
jgi:hypothetical protein